MMYATTLVAPIFREETELERAEERPGALIVSLDFELWWGVRDLKSLGRKEQRTMLIARSMVPLILETFKEFSVHATWATVGMLFASSREELHRFGPIKEPGYTNPRLNPYREETGKSEKDDPFHFAQSLIEAIAQTSGQELASHSFSHYYSMEDGQTSSEFEEDLSCAVNIAARYGHELRSYVFPRNQVNPAYLPVLSRYGFTAYRDTESTRIKRPASLRKQQRLHRRAARLLDSYLDLFGDQANEWPNQAHPAGLPASRYLRPSRSRFVPFRCLLFDRIAGQMMAAAQQGRVFHLWLHPEELAADPVNNLGMLRSVLAAYQELNEEYGMLSLSMSEILEHSREPSSHSEPRRNLIHQTL
jgi:peptidoglycan/xylan/chitin deacetylase (PgdA/CDA1 family)